MSKQNNTNTTNTTSINPFANLEAVTSANTTRKLAFTDILQTTAKSRATELVKSCTTPELAEQANRMLDSGDPADLLSLIHAVISDETIKQDATVLADCPTDDLPKMLESQRSNRSKAKRKGLRTSGITNVVDYVSAMYAELLIRETTGKSYNGGGNKLSDNHEELAANADLLDRKIASLASKKSRLSKLAALGDAAATTQLNEIEQELSELRALRPSKAKVSIKSVKLDDVRAALASLDESDMTPELLELMKKLG